MKGYAAKYYLAYDKEKHSVFIGSRSQLALLIHYYLVVFHQQVLKGNYKLQGSTKEKKI